MLPGKDKNTQLPNSTKQNILITGVTGFIGSHLALSLSSTANLYFTQRVHSENGDWRLSSTVNYEVLDWKLLRNGLLKTTSLGNPIPSFDCVYHLASSSHYSEEIDAKGLIDSTIGLTMDLLSFCYQNQSKKIIVAGSAVEYGSHELEALSENTPLDPTDFDGIAKASATRMSLAFAKQKNLSIQIARFFPIYGPADKPRNVIPSMIQAICTGVPLDLSPGEQIRDYIYIDDVITALHQMKDLSLVSGSVYNIGTGKGVSLLQVGKILLALSGGDPSLFRFDVKPYRDHEIMSMISDNTNAKLALNWIPKVTIESGLKQTYFWYKKIFERILNETDSMGTFL